MPYQKCRVSRGSTVGGPLLRVPGTWYLVYYKPIKPALERAPALPGTRYTISGLDSAGKDTIQRFS